LLTVHLAQTLLRQAATRGKAELGRSEREFRHKYVDERVWPIV